MTGAFGLLRLPTEVRFGWGARAALPELLAMLGGPVFVVTDSFLVTTEQFRETLEGIRAACAHVEVYSDIPAELPIDAVHRAADAAVAFDPAIVLGYGGGSALDAAKLVALLCSHRGALPDYYGENAVPGAVLPVVAVPTTAGTGSEVTPVAVVSDPDRELKVGISSPYLIPRMAVVDPELTMAAPRAVSVHAGIDAFVHAVESFTARALHHEARAVLPVFVGRDVLTEPLALEAAALIHRALPRVFDDLGDVRARVDMARGSLLAGIAFGSAGTHLSHAIQYPIGAMTHTPHGLGTGTLLPYVLQACVGSVPETLARLADALEVPGNGAVVERAQDAVDEIARLCARVGLPESLAELGLTQADTDRVVGLTLQVTRLVAIAPVNADRRAIEAIVHAAIVGDRGLLRGERPGERMMLMREDAR
ncbi:iron-containing alcohol dehydrogenase [Agromyces sp. NPDC049794]|uniref:iron-containing alcohol dehydrogenase n=1 Tax=unclassified Agromyces TaxID=2639701 RepID=UPI0033E71F4B